MLSSNKSRLGLRTVPVILKNGIRRLKVNALLDDASTKSYGNSDVAAELGLEGNLETVKVNVVNGNVEMVETMPVDFILQSLDGSVEMNVTALTTERVTGKLEVIDWKKQKDQWDHLTDLKFPTLSNRPIVDILIGIDYSDLHCSYRDIAGKPGAPIARLTTLGWTCIGDVSQPGQESAQTHFLSTYFIQEEENLSELSGLVRRYWEIEEVQSHDGPYVLKAEEQDVLKRTKETMTFQDGRYRVQIPWKDKSSSLPKSYDMAYQRLCNTEKRLSHDKNIADAYENILTEYLDKGYIRKVSEEERHLEDHTREWYLPHFPIVKPNRDTTKTRIVFNASAKCNGVSLNDFIHQGPQLQRDLLDCLFRFRCHPVAIMCDIAQMYLRIEVAPSDRPSHRFLWRSMNKDVPPDIYEFTRVVFGINSSPFLAQFVSQEHARKHKHDLAIAVETVINSTYMDDSMDSVIDNEQWIQLYHQLSELWEGAGMHPRKWLSNSPAVLEQIPDKDRASEVDLVKPHLPSVKTLGFVWQPETDVFTFQTNPNVPAVVTKRNFLRKLAQLFDPPGFIAPCFIIGKIIMQEIWIQGSDWDELLYDPSREKVEKWFAEFEKLEAITIPRCLHLHQSAILTNLTLHVFSDASQLVYGTVIYVVSSYENDASAQRLVVSKAHVAPLTTLSIPRMDLIAAVLGLKLARSMTRLLKLSIEEVVFWNDSMNVLWWNRGHRKHFKPFVANRIGEIQRWTSPVQWRYVPTKENAADILTRGTSATDEMKLGGMVQNF